MAYARWAGKRLLTPYEWCLAAMGRGVAEAPAWMTDYIKERNEVVSQVRKAHLNYVKNNAFMDDADFVPLQSLRLDSKCDKDPTRVHGYDFVSAWTAPWIAYSEGDTSFGPRNRLGMNDFPAMPNLKAIIDPVWRLRYLTSKGEYQYGLFDPQAVDKALEAAEWSKKTVQDLTDPLLEKWKDPGAVLPVGSRRYDVSRFGVRDMAMNARELVLASPFPILTHVGKPCVMGVGWSEAIYPQAAYRLLPLGSLLYRQGAFIHGTGRDGIIVDCVWVYGGDPEQFPPDGRIPWRFASMNAQKPVEMRVPDVVPLSRLVGRTTDWPPFELLMAETNLWESTAMLSQLNGVYLFEDPLETQRDKSHMFELLNFMASDMYRLMRQTFPNNRYPLLVSPMGLRLGCDRSEDVG